MWKPRILGTQRPLYLAIADAIGEDVEAGRLKPGTRLPPHRQLADELGVDFTTITRGYAEARRRGLIAGQAGRGTFVRSALDRRGKGAPRELIDLSPNYPPEVLTNAGAMALARTLRELATAEQVRAFVEYPPGAGRDADREAGARWIREQVRLDATGERVVIASGAQHAVMIALLDACTAGDFIATQVPTYSVLKTLATRLSLQMVGVRGDEEGIDPRALADACARNNIKVLYCTPTTHNPTAAMMSAERRRAIADIARRANLLIIEDDVDGLLVQRRPPALSSFAPERSFYVASLSKIVAPGLRTAYLLCPDRERVDRLVSLIHATTMVSSPLGAGIATRWIEDGTAERLLASARVEVRDRNARARAALKSTRATVRTHPASPHVWIELPAPWTTAEFVLQAQRAGVVLSPADSFWIGSDPAPRAVRMSVGAARSREELERALAILAHLLQVGAPSIPA